MSNYIHNKPGSTILRNKRAYHDYAIEDELEAGIVLLGSEVKSLRMGSANLRDSFVIDKKGELFINNLYIGEYTGANRFNHETMRHKKLLMSKRQIKKFMGKMKIKGYSILVLSLYFNSKNIAKVKIGLGKGKKEYDKRADIKDKEWQRQQSRLLRNKDASE